MRNRLKTSGAKQCVPLPATSSSSVKSARFLTVDVEPVEFTKVCARGDPAGVARLSRMPLSCFQKGRNRSAPRASSYYWIFLWNYDKYA